MAHAVTHFIGTLLLVLPHVCLTFGREEMTGYESHDGPWNCRWRAGIANSNNEAASGEANDTEEAFGYDRMPLLCRTEEDGQTTLYVKCPDFLGNCSYGPYGTDNGENHTYCLPPPEHMEFYTCGQTGSEDQDHSMRNCEVVCDDEKSYPIDPSDQEAYLCKPPEEPSLPCRISETDGTLLEEHECTDGDCVFGPLDAYTDRELKAYFCMHPADMVKTSCEIEEEETGRVHEQFRVPEESNCTRGPFPVHRCNETYWVKHGEEQVNPWQLLPKLSKCKVYDDDDMVLELHACNGSETCDFHPNIKDCDGQTITEVFCRPSEETMVSLACKVVDGDGKEHNQFRCECSKYTQTLSTGSTVFLCKHQSSCDGDDGSVGQNEQSEEEEDTVEDDDEGNNGGI